MPHRLRQSLYFPAEMLEEIEGEARRLRRPLSWVLEQAWALAKGKLHNYPSATPDTHEPAEARTSALGS
jgi:uncharacterized small protein (TIGR04563 family)